MPAKQKQKRELVQVVQLQYFLNRDILLLLREIKTPGMCVSTADDRIGSDLNKLKHLVFLIDCDELQNSFYYLCEAVRMPTLKKCKLN